MHRLLVALMSVPPLGDEQARADLIAFLASRR